MRKHPDYVGIFRNREVSERNSFGHLTVLANTIA